MDCRVDLGMALIIFAVGVFVIAIARTIPRGMLIDAVGASAFFYGIGIVFIVGSCLVAMRLLLSWKTHEGHMIPAEGTKDEEGYPASVLMAAGVVGISYLYGVLLKPLGYLITTPLYITGCMAIMRERRWGWIVLFAVGFTIVFYIAFAQILEMYIPVGPFTPLFRGLGFTVL